MEKNRCLYLKERAAAIRKDAVASVFAAGSGHPGGSLSISDVLAYLYFDRMNVSADKANDPDRDRFVLSKGHAAPALYSALALKGYFDESELQNLRHLGAMLQGHPDMQTTKGVDVSTGSLGQGFSAACGMAVAAKRQGKKYNVYTVIGDGESQEGMIWEAAMFASHYKLDNLIAFLDFNHLQIDGDVRSVMNPTPLDEKFKAFGWFVQVIDGHDFDAIDNAVTAALASDKPSMIICNTVKGKGVSFMENNYGWHGKAPKPEEYAIAKAELEAAYNQAKEALANG